MLASFVVTLPGAFAQTNDECSAAKVMTATAGAPYTDAMSTATATASGSDPVQCDGSGSNTVWYRFLATAAGTLQVNTTGSDYDTVLSIYTGSCGALSEVACNDDAGDDLQSAVWISTTPGATYYVMVASYDPGGGQLNLRAAFDNSTISGRVTAGGVGVPDVDVTVYDASDWDPVGYGYTDVNGVYTVGGLATGTYKVEFWDWTGTYITQWYNNKSSFFTGDVVHFTASNPTPGINASLVAGGTISGTVTAGGVGVPDVDVTVYGASDWDPVGYGSTDVNGVYTIGGLATGTYKVEFNDWYDTYITQWYNNKSSFDTGNAVSVTAPNPTTGINASLIVGGTISGTVTAGGVGVPDVDVTVYGASDWDSVGYGYTDINGVYTVGGLATGTYKVEFRDGNGTYITQWYNNKSSFDTGNAVSVTAPNPTTGINASLVVGGTISGTVTAGGVGVPDVDVTVYGASDWDPAGYGYTDVNGVYTVGGLATGTYKVEFDDWYDTYITQWYNNKSSFDTGNAVSVTAPNPTTGINASLVVGGTISGTVTAGGVGVPGVDVTVYGASDWDSAGYGYTDFNGVYTVGGLATGTYKVEFRDWNGTYRTQWYNNKSSFDTGNAVPVTAPNPTTGINASLVVAGLPAPWVGSVSITSNKNVVAVGRPHIGSEVASYAGFSAGALSAYLPMLFKDAFGGSYDSAFYVQNVNDTTTANLTIDFYDTAGNLSCTKTDQTVAPLASQGYWLPSEACLPTGWVGGVVITSDQPIVAIGRPHIGAQIMTYDGFSSGSLTSYLPMLFKDAFGGSYDSAFYVQNVDNATTANLTIDFYDNAGTLSCTKAGTVAPLASKGYWLPSEACLPAGWVGGVVVTSDQPIVTVGRPHIGAQITTYNGFSAGTASSYVPMLFKNAFGGSYNAAFYVQNVNDTTTANLTIRYYDNNGALSCTSNDTIAPLASKGTWVPGQSCLSAGWVGGVVVTSDQPIVAVGRPHIGEQVTTYNGFPSGNLNSYLPMLFNAAFGGSYNSAFYIQNTEASAADVTIEFYDTTGALTCTRDGTIPALATLGLWLPSLTCQ